MTTPIPEGYHSITPYLIVSGAAEALEWYKQALDATEVMRMPGSDGKLMHAEFKVGDSPVMMADEHPDLGFVGPETLGGAAVSLYLYVDDVDAVFKRAVGAGAMEVRPVSDQSYGDRCGTLQDPYGHTWSIATHVEDLTPDELQQRMAQQDA
jgi:PhnB protein